MAIGLFGGGISCTLLAVGIVLIVWLGKWAIPMQKIQLYILGGALCGFLIGMLLVLIALAVGGPLGRLKLSASKEGFGVEASGDGEK